jgi:CBS domain-containing protein
MSVGRYCRRKVFTAQPDETVRATAERMDKEGVGCVVVVERGRPVGILTDRDLVLEILCNRLDAGAVRVREIATRSPVTIREDAPLGEAAKLIRRHGVRRLPVVDEKEKLTGVIAADDLMLLVAEELGRLALAVRVQVPDLRRKG